MWLRGLFKSKKWLDAHPVEGVVAASAQSMVKALWATILCPDLKTHLISGVFFAKKNGPRAGHLGPSSIGRYGRRASGSASASYLVRNSSSAAA
jgi:hypothetical protein